TLIVIPLVPAPLAVRHSRRLSHSYAVLRGQHSFPTRRSSDLSASRTRRRPCARPTRPATASAPPCGPEIRHGASGWRASSRWARSEEHTSELQSRGQLVCRLLLEEKNGGHRGAAPGA